MGCIHLFKVTWWMLRSALKSSHLTWLVGRNKLHREGAQDDDDDVDMSAISAN